MKVNKVLPNPNLPHLPIIISDIQVLKKGPLWYFWGEKRGHQYAHFTVALINHTACMEVCGFENLSQSPFI